MGLGTQGQSWKNIPEPNSLLKPELSSALSQILPNPETSHSHRHFIFQYEISVSCYCFAGGKVQNLHCLASTKQFGAQLCQDPGAQWGYHLEGFYFLMHLGVNWSAGGRWRGITSASLVGLFPSRIKLPSTWFMSISCFCLPGKGDVEGKQKASDWVGT